MASATLRAMRRHFAAPDAPESCFGPRQMYPGDSTRVKPVPTPVNPVAMLI